MLVIQAVSLAIFLDGGQTGLQELNVGRGVVDSVNARKHGREIPFDGPKVRLRVRMKKLHHFGDPFPPGGSSQALRDAFPHDSQNLFLANAPKPAEKLEIHLRRGKIIIGRGSGGHILRQSGRKTCNFLEGLGVVSELAVWVFVFDLVHRHAIRQESHSSVFRDLFGREGVHARDFIVAESFGNTLDEIVSVHAGLNDEVHFGGEFPGAQAGVGDPLHRGEHFQRGLEHWKAPFLVHHVFQKEMAHPFRRNDAVFIGHPEQRIGVFNQDVVINRLAPVVIGDPFQPIGAPVGPQWILDPSGFQQFDADPAGHGGLVIKIKKGFPIIKKLIQREVKQPVEIYPLTPPRESHFQNLVEMFLSGLELKRRPVSINAQGEVSGKAARLRIVQVFLLAPASQPASLRFGDQQVIGAVHLPMIEMVMRSGAWARASKKPGLQSLQPRQDFGQGETSGFFLFGKTEHFESMNSEGECGIAQYGARL